MRIGVGLIFRARKSRSMRCLPPEARARLAKDARPRAGLDEALSARRRGGTPPMRNLARAATDERAAYVNETAAKRTVPAWMVEKDFWV